MATVLELGQKVKAKYPGTYDDLSDIEVGQKVKLKYPDAYSDFQDMPSLGQKAIEAYPQTLGTVAELQIDPLSLKADPRKAIRDAWNSIKDSVVGAGEALRRVFTNDTDVAPTPSERVGAGLEAVARTAGAVLSPISALFSAADQIPVLGSVSRLLTLPFEAIGETAPKLTDPIIDALPISDKVKADLKPGISEIVALAGQLALGKVADIGFKKAELAKRFGAKDAETIVNKAQELADQKAPENLATKGRADFEETRQAVETRTGKPLVEDVAKVSELKGVDAVENLDRARVENAKREIQEGKKRPLITEEGKVADGNHTLQAYKELGIEEVPILRPETKIDPLAAEASKYKTAEEFVKAQSDPLLEFKTLNTIENPDIARGTVKNSINDIGGINNVRRGEVSIGKLKTTENINTNSARYKAVEAEVKSGKITPIIADENLQIMDGHHRLEVYKAMGMENVPVIVPKETVGVKFKTKSQLTDLWNKVKGERPAVPEVKGAGETKTRGLSKGVEAKAVEKKLTESLGELPEYETVNMKEQAQKAVDLLSKDPEQARRIAMGEEAPPTGLIPEAVFNAVEELAIKNGDVNTLRDLATQSKLTQEATTMGQRIRTLAERNPESPAEAMIEVVKAREEAVKSRLKDQDLKKAKKDEAQKIKSEIKKIPKETWSSFIDSLKC